MGVGYSQSGAISALPRGKSSAEQLVGSHSNILIKVAKAVELRVIESCTYIHTYIRGYSLKQYIPCWLISESQLEERLECGTERGSAIIITVSTCMYIHVHTSEEAAKVCSKGLRFGGAVKVIEKYW